MPTPYIDDSLTGIINRLIDERVKFLRHYEGTVMAVKVDNSILVDSPDFGTSMIDPLSWVSCVPGNNNKSQIVPTVGDTVLFRWPSGDGSRSPEYVSFSAAYESTYGSMTKNVIYYAMQGLTQISEEMGAVTIKAGLAKFVVDPVTSSLTLSVANNTIKIDPSGIYVNGLPLTSHTHQFNDTGLGAVGQSVTNPWQ